MEETRSLMLFFFLTVPAASSGSLGRGGQMDGKKGRKRRRRGEEEREFKSELKENALISCVHNVYIIIAGICKHNRGEIVQNREIDH